MATDSDNFIIMEADASLGEVLHSGSMDHEPISSQALTYLEGGPATYKRKYRKYRGDKLIGDAD